MRKHSGTPTSPKPYSPSYPPPSPGPGSSSFGVSYSRRKYLVVAAVLSLGFLFYVSLNSSSHPDLFSSGTNLDTPQQPQGKERDPLDSPPLQVVGDDEDGNVSGNGKLIPSDNEAAVAGNDAPAVFDDAEDDVAEDESVDGAGEEEDVAEGNRGGGGAVDDVHYNVVPTGQGAPHPGSDSNNHAAPFKIDPDNLMAYRQHLDKYHAPHPYAQHSPTLTFSRIYVLSLPGRTDRRERMSKVLNALGLNFEFVNAVSSDEPVIQWIGERVEEVRNLKKASISKALKADQNHVGGLGVNSVWFDSSRDVNPITMTEAEAKIHKPAFTRVRTKVPYGSLKRSEYQGRNWVDYLHSLPHDSSLLKPSDPNYNVSERNWDVLEPIPARQLQDAVIATWYSQRKVLGLMKENNDDSALVLEDDVDIEWDIERIWPNIWRRLPKEGNGVTEPWHMAFLGHCWSREMTYPSYLNPYLHRSSEPRCLHGYALSRSGYNRLVELLDDPWVAYQGAIDTAVPTFISKLKLSSFSVEPSLIVQPKDTPSDILSGVGSSWKGMLSDSTMNRVFRDEGKIPPPENEVPEAMYFTNPATTSGYRLSPDSMTAVRESRKQEALHTGLDAVKARARGENVGFTASRSL